MGKRSQLWLPKFTKFERAVKYPQPHLHRSRPLKRYEIMYHPFDLRFRGRIGHWIEKLSSSEKIRLKEILVEEELKLILLYFYPQGKSKRWFNQSDVAKKLPKVNYWNFRDETVMILAKIWEESRKN